MSDNKNVKLKQLLYDKRLSVYGLSKLLGISPQAAEYVVKSKDLKADFERLEIIRNYLGVDNIQDFLD
jgi:DNA-binding Xre family transcriptional regulator